MAESIPEDEKNNYETFRECLSEVVLKGLAAPTDKPKRRRTKKRENAAAGFGNGGTGARKEEAEQRGDDAEELGEFIDVRYLPYCPFTPPLVSIYPKSTHLHDNLNNYKHQITNPDAVPHKSHLPLPAPLPTNPHLLDPQIPPPLNPRCLLPSPLPLLRRRHNLLTRPRDAGQPNLLRATPHIERRVRGRYPRPKHPLLIPPILVYRHLYDPAAPLLLHPHSRVRTMPARLDTADVPPSHSQGRSRQGAEAGVASRREAEQRRVVVQGLS